MSKSGRKSFVTYYADFVNRQTIPFRNSFGEKSAFKKISPAAIFSNLELTICSSIHNGAEEYTDYGLFQCGHDIYCEKASSTKFAFFFLEAPILMFLM